jgi:FKBP-type peptidyl-prolyl cis-trans isomerase FkpA
MTRILKAAAISAMVATTGFLSSCISTDIDAPRVVAIEETEFNSSLGVNLAGSTKTANGVYYRDITVGTGAVVATGQSLKVNYTLWFSNGVQVESGPYTFTLGTGNVIAGWHDGIPGMRVGGKRQLIIPPSMGYGSQGSGPIPGNAVLVFNIEVVSAT